MKSGRSAEPIFYLSNFVGTKVGGNVRGSDLDPILRYVMLLCIMLRCYHVALMSFYVKLKSWLLSVGCVTVNVMACCASVNMASSYNCKLVFLCCHAKYVILHITLYYHHVDCQALCEICTYSALDAILNGNEQSTFKLSESATKCFVVVQGGMTQNNYAKQKDKLCKTKRQNTQVQTD